MSEADNFLSRWSRRKRAAAEGADEPDRPIPAGVEGEAPAAAAPHAQQPQTDAPADQAGGTPAPPEVDLSSLPPIDSIGPDTDVRAFLRAGVPSALRQAALRRAWSSDPAIRDFRGLQESDWDFNDPDSIPGFGKLDADFDVRKMVARVFGETETETESEAEAQPATVEQPGPVARQSREEREQIATEQDRAEESVRPSATEEQDLVQREENRATQQEESAKPRRHGGALPQLFSE